MSIHFVIENEVITQEVFIGAGVISLLVTVTCLLSCFCPDPKRFFCYTYFFPPSQGSEYITLNSSPPMGSSPSRDEEAKGTPSNLIASKYLNAQLLSDQPTVTTPDDHSSHSFTHANMKVLSEMDLKTVTPLQRLDFPRNVTNEKMEDEILVIEDEEIPQRTSFDIPPESLIQGCIPHRVTKTDTLSGISLMYNVSAANIKRANKLYNDRDIHMLETLYIPVDSDLFFQSLDAAELKKRNEAIQQFASRCGVDRDVAEAYLNANGWSMQKSLQSFDRDAQESHEGGQALLSLRPVVEKLD